jgi:hypothetical protein
MKQVCRIYVRLCKRWGPCHLTLSAWAWMHAQKTGCVFWRNRIDGLFLLLTGQANHCQAQFQRETRVTHDAKGTRP